MTDMNLIEYEGGDVLASLEDRTVTGVLVPFNELGQTNAGRFMVEAGALALPSDPSVISLNLDHNRAENVGRGTRVWQEENVGIMATFAIANTPEGDDYLADVTSPAPKRKCLSGEFHTAIRAGKAVPGTGRLWGAAGVRAGAFPSAMVLASDTSTSNAKYVTEYTDDDGVTWRRVVETTRVTTVTETTTEEEQEGTDVPDTTTEEVQATVSLPDQPAATTAPRLNKHEVLAAIATLRKSPFDGAAREVLAALSDIKLSGAGALPADGVIQPSWLGRIDLGIEYVREYINLCKLGTDISAGGKKGFKFRRGTAGNPTWNDGTWAGNKTEINSGVGHTTTHASTLDRYARGADIGREFFDLPGGAEVIEAYLTELYADYLQWSDEKARALIVATAGAPVAPLVYPGVDGHDYAGAMGQLIQGILAAKRRKADGRRDTPTYAIANPVAYEELLYTPKDLVPEFVSFTVNTDGKGTADGKVHVVEGDTGVEDTSSVIVGADYAIEFDELPGGPLHVDAIELAKGGIDQAVHGYLQKFVRRPEAIVHIGVADD